MSTVVAPGDKFRIVVLGDGVAGAMAAAFLAQALPRDTHEILIVPLGGGDESLGAFGPVETTSPTIRQFHASLGLTDEYLALHGDVAFSLGVAFSGWSGAGSTYFLPFGDQGAPLDGVAFHQLVARLRAAGREIRLADFSAASLMAQAGRFERPADDPTSPLSTYSYGIQASRSLYARILRDLAAASGARLLTGNVKSIDRGADGLLGAAILDHGQRIHGDLFIDASGPAAIGVSALGRSNFETWAKYLPCDRCVELRMATTTPPSPYSHIEAVPIGWRRTVPSHGEQGEALVYSSAHSDRGAAEDMLIGSIGPIFPGAELSHFDFVPGRQSAAWIGNCIAIGAAACLLEPLCAQSMMLVENSLRRLVRLFPTCERMEIEAREFNRETGQELDRTRDFVVARYALNGRRGEPLWDAARKAGLPRELEEKLALYRGRGRIPLVDGDLYDEAEWAALLDGQGMRAERYDVRADGFSLGRLDEFLARMRSALVASIAPLPRHGEYLAALRRSARA